MWKPALLIAVALAAAPAFAKESKQRLADIQAGEAQLAKLTKGLVPGKPINCAPSTRWSGSTNIDGVGILYELGGQRYLNRLDPSCARFRFNDIPVIVSNGLTCRGDIVRIVDNSSGFPTGSCALGDFIPYERPKAR